MFTDEIKNQIITNLAKINPYKIILFGSHAYGNPDVNSDIDLLVVTNDEILPKNFAEKNLIYLMVSNAITDIEKTIPIDLVVHTKAMHKKFIALGSMFSKKITSKGIVLYEKTH